MADDPRIPQPEDVVFDQDADEFADATPLEALVEQMSAEEPTAEGVSPATVLKIERDLYRLYLRDVRSQPTLDAESEAALLDTLEAPIGEDAAIRDRLVCSHLAMAISLARRFVPSGVNLMDLIGEGNLGLVIASARFDPARGTRFSTYAFSWIRHYVQVAAYTQSHVVRRPWRRRGSRTGAEPAGMLPGDGILEVDADEYEDSLVFENDDEGALLLRPDKAPVLLAAALQQLDARERAVIDARFGLKDDISQSLGDIAQQMQLTREGVRQIELRAIGKLRSFFASVQRADADEWRDRLLQQTVSPTLPVVSSDLSMGEAA